MFHKCFRGVSEKFHVFLRVFQCSSVFDSMFTRSYNVFQWCFKEFSKKNSRCFREVSSCMALIAATRAEGGLVFLSYQNLGPYKICVHTKILSLEILGPK